MSLFIATGSNLGDKKELLTIAKNKLSENLEFIAESRIYKSAAVDYENQPDFYNQVLEFKIPKDKNPSEVMSWLLEVEKIMGRTRVIDKGPRTIDIDMLFWDDLKLQGPHLILPHPRLFERSFVVLPLSELPGYSELKKTFHFNIVFNNSAEPICVLT